MRANRTALRLRSERAEVGIGTMIVFIATTLVAAIAAAVLIDTSGKLQERSTRTGQETTQQVASNLMVEYIVALRDEWDGLGNLSSTLNWTQIYLGLAPGASNVDLAQMRVQVRDGHNQLIFQYSSENPWTGAALVGTFNTTAIRDADGSFTAATPVMNAGDLIRVSIANGPNGFDWGPRREVLMYLIPEVGNRVQVGFQTPASFGTDSIITLK
ncbi:MAG TPA: archaellin/type IV pilin N-terminal domain-containing protein [Candidatus Thermoplasmatota archaeon]|nr:archaellin/type IV pilin N-terminal domain-containing protein [Candidatus Thermoplasmatota archaeon]